MSVLADILLGPGAQYKSSAADEMFTIFGIPLIEEYDWQSDRVRLRCGTCGLVFCTVSHVEIQMDRNGDRLRTMVMGIMREERAFHQDPRHTLETVAVRKGLFGSGDMLATIRNPPSEEFLRVYGGVVLKAHNAGMLLAKERPQARGRVRVRVIRVKGADDGED